MRYAKRAKERREAPMKRRVGRSLLPEGTFFAWPATPRKAPPGRRGLPERDGDPVIEWGRGWSAAEPLEQIGRRKPLAALLRTLRGDVTHCTPLGCDHIRCRPEIASAR